LSVSCPPSPVLGSSRIWATLGSAWPPPF
jgi:hypothetical protein